MFTVVQTETQRGITEHIKRLRAMRCVVSGMPGVTLHHCKGGSMLDLLGQAGNPGGSRKVSDWLQIPLGWRYHIGDYGIDNGMGPYKDKRAWEAAFGTQVWHLIQVSAELGYNVFHKAGFTVDIAELRHL